MCGWLAPRPPAGLDGHQARGALRDRPAGAGEVGGRPTGPNGRWGHGSSSSPVRHAEAPVSARDAATSSRLSTKRSPAASGGMASGRHNGDRRCGVRHGRLGMYRAGHGSARRRRTRNQPGTGRHSAPGRGAQLTGRKRATRADERATHGNERATRGGEMCDSRGRPGRRARSLIVHCRSTKSDSRHRVSTAVACAPVIGG